MSKFLRQKSPNFLAFLGFVFHLSKPHASILLFQNSNYEEPVNEAILNEMVSAGIDRDKVVNVSFYICACWAAIVDNRTLQLFY